MTSRHQGVFEIPVVPGAILESRVVRGQNSKLGVTICTSEYIPGMITPAIWVF